MPSYDAVLMMRTLGLAAVAALLLGCPSSTRDAATRSALTSVAPAGPELHLTEGGTVAEYGRLLDPSVAGGGDLFVAAWTTSLGVAEAARVRVTDGALLDGKSVRLGQPGEVCTSAYGQTAVGFTAGTFLIVWTSTVVGGNQLCAVRMQPDGTILDRPAKVLSQSQGLNGPAIAGDGTNFFVVWADGRNPPPTAFSSPSDVYGARVRASDGALLDPNGIAIAVDPTKVENRPAIATDGTTHLVTWIGNIGQVGGPLSARRIRASDGAVLDTTAIPLAQVTSSAAVAFDGVAFMPIWEDSGNTLRFQHVRPSDGALLEGAPALLASGALGGLPVESDPSVAFDGNNLFLTLRAGDQVRGLRFDRTGTALGGALVVDADAWAFGRQRVAYAGGKYQVVWNRDEPGHHQSDNFNTEWLRVRGAPVDPGTGTLGPALSLSNSAARQTTPSASYDGRQHLVVWNEYLGDHFEIRGARVRHADGALLDATGFAISGASAANQVYGRTASNGSNHLVIWWDGTRLRATRVRGDDGALLDQPPLMLPALPGVWSPDSPRFGVASDGHDYLVTWIEGGENNGATPPEHLYTLRVGGDGALLDSTPRVLVTATREIFDPAVELVGSQYLVSWNDYPTLGGNVTVRAKRVARDGTPVEPALDLSPGTSAFIHDTVVGALGADTAVVFWNDVDGLFGRRVRMSDAMVLDGAPLAINPHGGAGSYIASLSAGFDGQQLVMLMQNLPPGMAVARMDSDGTVLPAASPLPAAGGWSNYDPALSVAPDNRVLAAYFRFDPAAATERLQIRFLGEPFPALTPDAALAVDAPTVDAPAATADAAPAVDGPATLASDAPVAPTDAPAASTDASPPVDGPATLASDAPVAPTDAPVVPTDAPTADARTTVDGVSSYVDGRSPADGPATDTALVDAHSTTDTHPATDARLADASTDAGGPPPTDSGCSCQLGARPSDGSSRALLVVPGLLFALRARRRRRRRDARETW
jgi:hypothetical protein